MEFTRSNLLIGEGNLTGAVKKDDRLYFFIDSDGLIISRNLKEGSRGLSREEFASYADAYTQTQNFSISLYGDEMEIARI